MTGFKYRLDLRIAFWQGNNQWPLPVGCQTITFVRRGVFRVPQQGMAREHGFKSLYHLRLPF